MAFGKANPSSLSCHQHPALVGREQAGDFFRSNLSKSPLRGKGVPLKQGRERQRPSPSAKKRFSLSTPTYPATGPHLYLAVSHQAEKSQQWGLRCRLEGNLLSVPCSRREGRRNARLANSEEKPRAVLRFMPNLDTGHHQPFSIWRGAGSGRVAQHPASPGHPAAPASGQPQLPPAPSRPISRNPWHANRMSRSPLPPPVKIKGTARARREQNVKPSAS